MSSKSRAERRHISLSIISISRTMSVSILKTTTNASRHTQGWCLHLGIRRMLAGCSASSDMPSSGLVIYAARRPGAGHRLFIFVARIIVCLSCVYLGVGCSG